MAGAMHQLHSFGLSMEMGRREDPHTHLDMAWREFFRDPSMWWDNHSSKRYRMQPDFKHKATKEPLWMDSLDNPSWVKDELIRRGYSVGQLTGNPIAAADVSPSLIWACCKNRDLSTGSRIHHELQKRGLPEKRYSDALVAMYAKCGKPRKAQVLLDMHSSSSVIPWTALIASYARHGQGQNAINCFEQMQHKGIPPNAVTYLSMLKACAVIRAINKGKQIHDELLKQGFLEHSTVLGNALVDMYAKCGDLSQAHSILEKLPSRDVVSWSALIAGYSQMGQGQQALECFEQMQHEGISPNAVTYVCILKACALIGAFDKGKQIHDEISRQGLLEHSIELGGALVDMYAKCDALSQAHSILEKLPSRDVVSWSSLIAGYAHKGQGQQALECFEQMQQEGIPPNAVTYAYVLKACALIGSIDKGKHIHDAISRQGLLEHNTVLGLALVDMYAKCGALHLAHSVLEKLPSRDVVAWSLLIAGYAQIGHGQQALECFEQMQLEGISPNVMTYVSILKACAAIGDLEKGKQIHEKVSMQGLLEHSIELGGALVDMYAKCGDLAQSQHVLWKLPSRNVVVWNALIAGLAQKGQGQKAVECFKQMQHDGIPPSAVTYMLILKACAVIGAIDQGKQIHEQILRKGLLEHSIEVGCSLVDMYAKCGALPQAQSVLEKLPFHSVVLWNSLITGYAQEGQAEQAFNSFEQMQFEGILPDAVTFLCLLKMCSHLGLVEKAEQLFDSMGAKYGLKPDLECFTCMIDLLGRAGHLVRAVELIQEMPFSPDYALWQCLLGACSKWVDVNIGTWAFEHAVQIDKCEGASYIQMANIFAAAGMPEKAKDVEAMRLKNKPWKLPGCYSWTDPIDTALEFCVGDTKHAQIKRKREGITLSMSLEGCYPKLNWVSRDMFEASKVQLGHHSEKLALACMIDQNPSRRQYSQQKICVSFC